MAYTAKCDGCGAVTLTVRVSAEDASRRCCDCVAASEFEGGTGRKLRGFLRWRVRRDDVHDDRRAASSVEDQLRGPFVAPPGCAE